MSAKQWDVKNKHVESSVNTALSKSMQVNYVKFYYIIKTISTDYVGSFSSIPGVYTNKLLDQ